MKPWLVFSAQAEWILPPTKYRLSKTCAESAYHTSRAGTALGSRIKSGGSLVGGPALAAQQRHQAQPTQQANVFESGRVLRRPQGLDEFLVPVPQALCLHLRTRLHFESPRGVSRPSLHPGHSHHLAKGLSLTIV